MEHLSESSETKMTTTSSKFLVELGSLAAVPNGCGFQQESAKRRRSYVFEDLPHLELERKRNEEIMRRVYELVEENRNEFLEKIGEKDSSIEKLKVELNALKLASRGGSTDEQVTTQRPKKPQPLPIGGSSRTSRKETLPKNVAKSAMTLTTSKAEKSRSPTPLTSSRNKPGATNGTNATVSRNARLKPNKTLPDSKSSTGSILNRGNNRNVPKSGTGISSEVKPCKKAETEPAVAPPVALPPTDLQKTSSDAAEKAEMATHLRRLTEEHAKLQAEYSRVRSLLREANIKCSSASRLHSPVPSGDGGRDGVGIFTATEDVAATSHSAMLSPKLEVCPAEEGSAAVDDKEVFRKEVLRLKEELLDTQQQLAKAIEGLEQEVTQHNLEAEELRHELMVREENIEKLNHQMERMKISLHDVINEQDRRLHVMKASEKQLVARLKEVEQEAKETKEFMQDENNSLSEALREAEEKAQSHRSEIDRLQFLLDGRERECAALLSDGESSRSQLQQLQSELDLTQDAAQQLLLRQGTELSYYAVSVRRLHRMVDAIVERVLRDASALGVDVDVIATSDTMRKRRSGEGRRLVQAILAAARTGDQTALKDDEQSPPPPLEVDEIEAVNSPPEVRGNTPVKDVEQSVQTLERVLVAVSRFLFNVIDDAERERTKLENDLDSERRRLDELQTEIDDVCRKRWLSEERCKDLTKELREVQESVVEARELQKEAWNKVDEQITMKIENKKLKEDLVEALKRGEMLSVMNTHLDEELSATLERMQNGGNNGQDEKLAEYVSKQVSLKKEVSELQRRLLDKEEELLESNRKFERNKQLLNSNLHSAETEVRKLDGIIDHILKVLRDSNETEAHPVLQQLWRDLDGDGYVNVKMNV